MRSQKTNHRTSQSIGEHLPNKLMPVPVFQNRVKHIRSELCKEKLRYTTSEKTFDPAINGETPLVLPQFSST